LDELHRACSKQKKIKLNSEDQESLIFSEY